MIKNQKGNVAGVAALIYLAVIVAAIAGWIMNIAGIVHTIGGPITAMFIARCVGVLAFPLGAVLGYF
jgi:hypothetical protein